MPTPPEDSGRAIPLWLIIVDAVIACALIALLVVVLFALPSPTPDQRDVLRVLTAILFGALGACLTGTAVLKVNLGKSRGTRFAISATAGMALLLIAYLVPPYWSPPEPTKGNCVQNPAQRGC